MSETHDPMNLTAAELRTEYSKALAMVHELATARAAEATQHAQEIAAKDEHIAVVEGVLREHSEFGGLFQPGGRFHRVANLRLGGSAVADGGRWLVARLAAVEAERDEKDRQVAAVYADVDRLTNQKRALEAERDRLKAALSTAAFALDLAGFRRDRDAAYAALTPQGQSTDGETR